MRRKNGFTLVEVMVVVSIIILLLAWGIPSYSAWKRKHDVEGQMLGLYNNLQVARMTAYGRKVVTAVWWGSGASISSYQVKMDSDNDGTFNDAGDTAVGASVSVGTAITVSPAQNSISFDGRGFLNQAISPVTFSVATNTGAAINCLTVSSTRIMTGRMNAGVCTPQ